MKTVIFLASSDSKGNTAQAVEYCSMLLGADIKDITLLKISPFDYNYKNQDDDFLPFISSCIDEYHTFVLASPIYWYNVSGQMKIFLDRFSDLLEIRQEEGRKLRGKRLAALSTSSHDDQGEYYWKPYELTANYLGMEYLGSVHVVVEDKSIGRVMKERIAQFCNKIIGP